MFEVLCTIESNLTDERRDWLQTAAAYDVVLGTLLEREIAVNYYPVHARTVHDSVMRYITGRLVLVTEHKVLELLDVLVDSIRTERGLPLLGGGQLYPSCGFL